MAILLYGIAALLGCWLLGNLFTYPLQDFFIFRPKQLKKDYRFNFARTPVEIFLTTPHRGCINALHFQTGCPPKGVILYFHGNADNLARWGHLYYFFERFEYDFFVYDYRGFGKSTGPRNERNMYEDARAVFDYVRQHYPTSQIILFGRSLGSAFACRVAADNHDVRALILETPFASMKNLFYTYYPFLPRVFTFKYVFPNRRYLKQARCPVYIFQGVKDWVVPYVCAARLKSCLKPNDEFITIPDGGHNNLIFYDIYTQKMQEILQ